MLITMRDPKTGVLTPTGQLLENAGLVSLPESFNVDDGFVERGRQVALVEHPQLTNTDWVNLGYIYAARQYASDHPVLGKCRLCGESPLEHTKGGVSDDHAFLPLAPSRVGPDDPIALAMHEAVHGAPKPVYVDASEPLKAAAERKAAELKAVPKVAADDHGSMTKEQVEAISGGAQTVPVPDTPEMTEAVAFIVDRGYSEEFARDAIKRHGVEQILADKRTNAPLDPEPDTSSSVAGTKEPSAEDLDRVAEEQGIKEATGTKKNGPKPAKQLRPN